MCQTNQMKSIISAKRETLGLFLRKLKAIAFVGCIALLLTLQPSIAHAAANYETGYVVAQPPMQQPYCSAHGGTLYDNEYGAPCVFRAPEDACRAKLAWYIDTYPGYPWYQEIQFVEFMPYLPWRVRGPGSPADNICVQADNNGTPFFGVNTSGELGPINYGYYPIITLGNVARCKPGVYGYVGWEGYLPDDPASFPKCPDEDPGKGKGNSCPSSLDPINIGTGNKWKVESDFVSASGPLRFVRTYNLIEPMAHSRMGYGWTHTYRREISPPRVLSNSYCEAPRRARVRVQQNARIAMGARRRRERSPS